MSSCAAAELAVPAAVDGGSCAAAAAEAGRLGDSVDLTSESISKAIDRLKESQAKLRAEKRAVSKELRNAQKRKSRLKRRARQLTDGDLVELQKMRKTDVLDSSCPAAPANGGGSVASGSGSSSSSSASVVSPSTAAPAAAVAEARTPTADADEEE